MATAIQESPAHGSNVGEAEREARLQLAACYRVFDMLGWSEMIYNHITLKVPGEEGAFLINPFGLHFSEVTASSLVKIDIDGNKLDDSPYPVNRAGFVQHALFHRHLPDAHCIMHTHTTAGMAVSSVEGGLRPTNFYACSFAGQIAYHDFEGVTVRDEEGVRLLEHLGDKRVMLLRNHGILVMGKTLPEAFIKHWSLQRACEIQVATASMGTPLVVPDEVVAVHQRDLHLVQIPGGPGAADFAAMVRLVDRGGPELAGLGMRLSAAEVADHIRGFLDGTDGSWDWDDFTSIPVRDPALEAIRRQALAVDLPLTYEGTCALQRLLGQATALAELEAARG